MNRFASPRAASGRIFLLIVIALGAIAAGIVISSMLLDRSQELRTAQIFPDARPLPEFELRAAAGESLTSADLKGRWSLIFFGFTNCPDICPDTMAMLHSVIASLDTMGAASKPQVIFISLDPGRDDAEALKAYVHSFDEDFIGATADADQLEKLTRSLGIYYALGEPEPDSGYYTVDHSASILIIDPQGRLLGRFVPPLDRQAVAADLFALTR